MLRSGFALIVLCLLTGCGLPRDPEGTSKRIAADHVLRVGVADNAPCFSSSRDLCVSGALRPKLSDGVMVTSAWLVKPSLDTSMWKFASRIGAKVEWTTGSETNLAMALKHHELDLAIGGFDAKTPWKSIAGVSQPFVETSDKKKHIFLTAPGENRFILTLDTFLTAHMRKSTGAGA